MKLAIPSEKDFVLWAATFAAVSVFYLAWRSDVLAASVVDLETRIIMQGMYFAGKEAAAKTPCGCKGAKAAPAAEGAH